MKIIKYEKKGNDKYRIYLENNLKIDVYEDVIIKNNLLYKQELTEELLVKLDHENSRYDLYHRAVKYISVRIRSTQEIYNYLKKDTDDYDLITEIIEKLQKNKLLDDEQFTKAFINDKFKFSSMGPYMIVAELKKHHVSEEIIYKYLNQISNEEINEKMTKQINKIIKSTKQKDKLKHKIYTNLMRLGYPSDDIMKYLNNNL